MATHVLALQIWPAAQTVPQKPQLSLLDARVTHVPEQFVCPVGQLVVQVLLTQTWPDEQAWPHEPQLAPSEVSVTHAPPQFVWPEGQLTPQTPSLQTSPSAHALPQVPQCARSVSRLAQIDPVAAPGPLVHTVCPLGQLVLQVPPRQTSPDAQA